jgi:hypothetical protein
VEEYPFYSDRLRPIDYKKYAAQGDDWKDPYFPPTASSILDPEMEVTPAR